MLAANHPDRVRADDRPGAAPGAVAGRPCATRSRAPKRRLRRRQRSSPTRTCREGWNRRARNFRTQDGSRRTGVEANGKVDSKGGRSVRYERKDDETVKDEKYWAGRKKDLDEQLARDQIYADALQSRINALTTDFVNRDDPSSVRRSQTIGRRSIDEMERLKAAIAADKKAIADFRRKRGAPACPPGWLR
jgi:hypothetical protein